jgi:hypothetical protein
MVKAKDLLNFLCEDLDYRFFVGTSVEGSVILHKAMAPDFMHYVPAVHAASAFGMAVGASLFGANAVIIATVEEINSLDWKAIEEAAIPVLAITFSENTKAVSTVPIKGTLSSMKAVKSLTSRINKQSKPGVLCIKEGQLK